MADELIERRVNPRTGEAFELQNDSWVRSGIATEDELRKAMKDAQDEAALTREQMKQVSTDPDYLAMKQDQAREGSASFGRALLRSAPAIAVGVATGGATAALGAGRLATMGMEATGQGMAEMIAQKMMGEPSSPESVALAGSIPLGMRALVGAPKGLAKGIAKRSKGGQARVAEEAGVQAQKYLATNQLIPDDAAVNAAYKAVGEANPRVFLPGLRETSKALKTGELKNPKAFQDVTLVKELTALEKDLGRPTGVTFDRVNSIIKKLNAELPYAEGTRKKALQDARAAIWDDLDNLANTQTAGKERDALSNAIYTARRNFAVKDLNEAFRTSTRRNDTSLHVFNAPGFLNKLDDLKQDPLFAKGLKEELPAIERHFEEVAKTLVKTSPQGTAIIFGAGGGAIGAPLGESMLGSPGVGAAAGAGLGVMLPDLFTKLALTENGRKLTLKLLVKGNGRIAMPALITAANAIAAGVQTKPDELKTLATSIQKNPNISLEQKVRMAQQLGPFSQPNQ